LYRLHIRPGDPDSHPVDPAQVVDFCLKKSVFGIGWGTWWYDLPQPVDWDNYLELCEQQTEWTRSQLSSVIALQDAEVGSHIWTRGTSGIYYLGRIIGPWRYLTVLCRFRRPDLRRRSALRAAGPAGPSAA
jgi:hypothetical protein